MALEIGDPAETLAAIETEQQRLWDLIAGADPAILARRPRASDRSILEDVRHLLFANQAHLGQFVRGGVHWSPYIIPPPGLVARLEPRVGAYAEPHSLDEVLLAWRESHDRTRESLLPASPAIRKALAVNLRHLRNHTKVIERLLRTP